MIEINVSIFPPTFQEQLEKQGYIMPNNDAEKFEDMKKSMMKLYCNDYLTASQKDCICRKIVKRIGEVAIPIEKARAEG